MAIESTLKDHEDEETYTNIRLVKEMTEQKYTSCKAVHLEESIIVCGHSVVSSIKDLSIMPTELFILKYK